MEERRSDSLDAHAGAAGGRMIMKTTPSGLERLKRNGYRCFHLFGNVYLVRNYSVNAQLFSLYGLVVVRKGE